MRIVVNGYPSGNTKNNPHEEKEKGQYGFLLVYAISS